MLERLVALNAERAAEEARGVVRGLRPEFQNPQAAPTQQAIDTGPEEDPAEDIVPTASIKPQPWPKDAVAQVRALADALSASTVPLSLDEIAARFTARGRGKSDCRNCSTCWWRWAAPAKTQDDSARWVEWDAVDSGRQIFDCAIGKAVLSARLAVLVRPGIFSALVRG